MEDTKLCDVEGDASPSNLSHEAKQLRTLKKKVRQCEALQSRRDAGEALTDLETTKLAKLDAWREEIAEIESRL